MVSLGYKPLKNNIFLLRLMVGVGCFGTHILGVGMEAHETTGKTVMNTHTAPLPFPAPTHTAPTAGDRAVKLGDTPLSAHEKMAVADLLARIAKARARLFRNRSTPEWIVDAVLSHLSGHERELESSDPFIVRLGMAYPPTLPKGV